MKDLSACNILIVDDIKMNVELLARALDGEWELTVAFSGERALELMGRRPPDLVLLDILMPDMDGYEVCTRMRADPNLRDVPVVFLTALDDAESKAKGFEVGGTDFLGKPIDVQVVRARVRSLLEKGLSLEITDRAKEHLAEQGYDPKFGARPLRRAIQTDLEDLLSDDILAGKFTPGDTIFVDVEDSKLVIQAQVAAASK